MNYGVDTHFYPLGSCTMKYNPKINEDMARLGGFGRLHPLAPGGALRRARCSSMHDLGAMLAEIAGMDAVSLQPAAGAQGELAGVLMIRAYHEARGREADEGADPRLGARHQPSVDRAGRLRGDRGQVRRRGRGRTSATSTRHLGPDVAAFMITVPNTLGNFEPRVVEIGELCHARGAQVYMDGANLQRHPRPHAPRRSRLRRLPLQPAQDVHHPARRRRAGLGPGRRQGAPRAVPAGAGDRQGREQSYVARLEAAPVDRQAAGVLGQLRHARARLHLHPHDGRRRAAGGERERGAQRQLHHEAAGGALRRRRRPAPACTSACCRRVVRRSSASPPWISPKRLLDLGFYAPSTYFPLIVEEALMIEPTETESKETLDAFCEAMIRIAQRGGDRSAGDPRARR